MYGNKVHLLVLLVYVIGPILDDRLKEKLMSFVSVCVSVCVCVCLSVCPLATRHTFWPRNLIFGSNDLWDMRKKHIFFLRNVHF